MTHYRLTMLSKDLNLSISALIRTAIESRYGSTAQIPIEDMMAFISSYNVPVKPMPAPAPPMPDWLDE